LKRLETRPTFFLHVAHFVAVHDLDGDFLARGDVHGQLDLAEGADAERLHEPVLVLRVEVGRGAGPPARDARHARHRVPVR
jgi:hypothetical protein